MAATLFDINGNAHVPRYNTEAAFGKTPGWYSMRLSSSRPSA